MTTEFRPDTSDIKGRSTKSRNFGHEVPMARPGQPEELAPAYVLLASSDGSFMTGSPFEVTGEKMSGE